MIDSARPFFGVLASFGVMLAFVWMMGAILRGISQTIQRQTAERSAGQALTRTPPWVLVSLIAAIAALIHYQPGTLQFRPGPPAVLGPGDMSMPPWLPPAPLVAILLLLIARDVRAYRDPGPRIVRLIDQQRYDQATALIRSRMARRRPGWSTAATTTPNENPYTPPERELTLVEQRAEADDWNNLGAIASGRRNHAEALNCFERAEALGASNPLVPRINRGLTLIALGQTDEGMARAAQALAEVPDDERGGYALFHLILAERLIDARRLADAGPILDQAEQDQPRGRWLARSARHEYAARLAAARARLAEAGGVELSPQG